MENETMNTMPPSAPEAVSSNKMMYTVVGVVLVIVLGIWLYSSMTPKAAVDVSKQAPAAAADTLTNELNQIPGDSATLDQNLNTINSGIKSL